MPEAFEVPLNRILSSPRYRRILIYPRLDDAEARWRIKELSAIGVSTLRFAGVATIDGIPILGKGCVGIVTQARLGEKLVALKLRRLDADRPSMSDEARLLRLANSIDVGPRLITATKEIIAMQLVEGLPLYRWAEKQKLTKRVVREVVADLLDACFKLDSIGLDHGELSHAPKNVLINQYNHPVIVDFETASTVRRPANVTSLMQYFLFGEIARNLNTPVIFQEKKRILSALAEYKHQGSVESFRRLLGVLGLS